MYHECKGKLQQIFNEYKLKFKSLSFNYFEIWMQWLNIIQNPIYIIGW